MGLGGNEEGEWYGIREESDTEGGTEVARVLEDIAAHLEPSFSHRHNTLWGVQAPSRLPLIQRSISDPNIQQSLLEECMEHAEHEEPFLGEEGTLDDFCTLPTSPRQYRMPSEGMGYTWSSPMLNSLPFDQSTPIDKIHRFLASQPHIHHPDDDQGIENMCTSDSGSGYSSPILTPPDEEQIHTHLYRFAKEIHKEAKQRLTNDELESKDVCSGDPPNGDKQSSPLKAPPKLDSRGKDSSLSPPPPCFSVDPSERSQLVASLDYSTSSHLPTKAARSVSLPHSTPSSGYLFKGTSVSPNSSKTSLSSLAQEGPNSRAGSVAENRPPLLREDSPSNDNRISSVRSESPSETPKSLWNHHRRAKSDTCDVSGPVKTAQIHSVPERVKEIEEMHAQATKIQLPSQPQTLERPAEFFVGSSGGSPRPDPTRPSSVGSMSRTSSEESLPSQPSSQLSSHSEEQEEEVPSNMKLSTSPRITSVRHTSLSPTPFTAKSLSSHLPLQSSLSLPHNIPPPESDPTWCGQDTQSLSDEDIATSLQGAVKARIQDIEERNKEDVTVKARKPSSEKSEGVAKLTPPPSDPRSSGDMTEPRRNSMVIESNTKISPFDPIAPRFSRRPSSDLDRPGSIMDAFSRQHRETTPSSSLRSIANTSKFMSVENLSSDSSQIASVQQLKRRFEDTDGTATSLRLGSGENLRRSQSLRGISCSRVKIRPRLPTLTPSSQLGHMESVQNSPPQSDYITTLPSFQTDTVKPQDFETTRSKFDTLTAIAD